MPGWSSADNCCETHQASEPLQMRQSARAHRSCDAATAGVRRGESSPDRTDQKHRLVGRRYAEATGNVGRLPAGLGLNG